MSDRGFTSKEILLAVVVLAVTVAILVPVAMSMQRKGLVDSDVDRMRRLYMSTAMYEQDANGYLPPDLLLARPYVPSDLAYLSTKDPFASVNGDKFPVDAGLPEWRVVSPVRISYTYLYSFAAAKKIEIKPWYELKYEEDLGMIADEWHGEVQPGESFNATVGGKVLRLNTNGALRQYERGSGPVGDAKVLFLKKQAAPP